MKSSEDCSPHGWTTDTLETYLNAKIEALARQLVEYEERNKERFESARNSVKDALTSSEKAINKAEVANEHRLASVNEFREQLADQERNLLPRPEYQVQHQALVSRIDKAEASIVQLLTTNSVTKATPIMIATITGVVINILMFSGLFIAFFLHLKNGG